MVDPLRAYLFVTRGPTKIEEVMSLIDQALKANELYAKTYDPKWGAPQAEIGRHLLEEGQPHNGKSWS